MNNLTVKKLIKLYVGFVLVISLVLTCAQNSYGDSVKSGLEKDEINQSLNTDTNTVKSDKVEVRIPLKVLETENGNIVKDNFVFSIIPENSGYPKSKAEKLKLKNGEKGFFTINFSNVGKYYYEIRQEKGNDPYVKSYDDSVYRVEILVYYQEDGSKASAIGIKKSGYNGKFDELEFENKIMVRAKTDKPNGTKNPWYKGKSEEVITGDNAKLVLWGILLAGAVMFLIGILIKNRKAKY